MIETGVAYAQRSNQGTAILFVKYPAGKEKVNLEATDSVAEWMNAPLGSSYRG